MSRKTKTEKEKAFDQLAEAVAVFLGSIGWSALVVGNPTITQQPGEVCNYEFSVRFTGKKLEEKAGE